MDGEARHRQIENEQAANFFNAMAASTAPITGSHISFSRPQHSALAPTTHPSGALPPPGHSSETHPPPPNRARTHFERAAQGLPPLLSQHGPGHLHHSTTPPFSPLNLFSPRSGFPGPVFSPPREGHNEVHKDGIPPLAPLSPMNYTPVLSSPMEALPSPMYHIGQSSQQVGECTPRGLTPQHYPIDSSIAQKANDNRDMSDPNSIAFSRHCSELPPSLSTLDPHRTCRPNENSRIGAGGHHQTNASREMTSINRQGIFFPESQKPSHVHSHPHPGNLSSTDFPESPMFRPLDQIPLNLPGQHHASQGMAHPSGHGAVSSVFQTTSQALEPISKPLSPAHAPGKSRIGIHGNCRHLGGNATSSFPSPQHLGHVMPFYRIAHPDEMDVDESSQQSAALSGVGPSTMRVLPQIIIDRPLIRAADVLAQKVVRSPRFPNLVHKLKEGHRLRKEDSCGGTVRRRSDQFKQVVKLEEYGYPLSDREDIHNCLDTAPGLSRENIEYLKKVVISQLETVKRGAREALYQFSIVLVDQLRYRVMTKEDILSLQCSVVDRFIVARNCILEKYVQYIRSRRWIENMSTNQRRGCLTHQQNNILRMWLYRNFTDPYPDEDAKEMMIQETKLSMDQVNNWLINARSRFWKPCMDYFDRSSLERKMGMLIRQRMVMTVEEKLRTGSKFDQPESTKGRNRRSTGEIRPKTC